MARSVFSTLVLLTVLASTNAYWLMGIEDFITTERLDPVVNPGKVSGHVHSVLGGSNFRMTTNTASLRNSECTSIPIPQDKSNYWFPHLYFQWSNGSFTSLDGGAVIYYLFNDQPGTTTAFPDDFRMLSGTPTLRTYDPNSYAQQAVTFLCLDFNGVSTRYNSLPPKACPSGVRAQINFPSCWDGKNLDSPDHKSHVAFLSGGPDSGTCSDPKYPVTLPRIFIEVYWNTGDHDKFRSQAMNSTQPFVYSYGDPTGYGYHADFINGWDKGVLQKAVDGCNCNPYGDPTCCVDKGIFNLDKGKQCRITKSIDEPTTGTLPKLPGNNPVQKEGTNAITYTDTTVPVLLSPVYAYTSDTPPNVGKPIPPASGPSSSVISSPSVSGASPSSAPASSLSSPAGSVSSLPNSPTHPASNSGSSPIATPKPPVTGSSAGGSSSSVTPAPPASHTGSSAIATSSHPVINSSAENLPSISNVLIPVSSSEPATVITSSHPGTTSTRGSPSASNVPTLVSSSGSSTLATPNYPVTTSTRGSLPISNVPNPASSSRPSTIATPSPSASATDPEEDPCEDEPTTPASHPEPSITVAPSSTVSRPETSPSSVPDEEDPCEDEPESSVVATPSSAVSQPEATPSPVPTPISLSSTGDSQASPTVVTQTGSLVTWHAPSPSSTHASSAVDSVSSASPCPDGSSHSPNPPSSGTGSNSSTYHSPGSSSPSGSSSNSGSHPSPDYPASNSSQPDHGAPNPVYIAPSPATTLTLNGGLVPTGVQSPAATGVPSPMCSGLRFRHRYLKEKREQEQTQKRSIRHARSSHENGRRFMKPHVHARAF